ncbi:hypothetical protein [Bacillus vallismortis]|uniref:hypothetical protein n=1 Tax=Bacillus vallismortis TaxID=72361 RepID=UPI00227F1F99|nr:hypothetical protein [Bacillus vallismortis]MCY7919897.1 hypothetical protein [Bacillus vallismortis]MCY8308021.1 hypothetical protein [Bacillus vallismortis]
MDEVLVFSASHLLSSGKQMKNASEKKYIFCDKLSGGKLEPAAAVLSPNENKNIRKCSNGMKKIYSILNTWIGTCTFFLKPIQEKINP